MIILGAKLKSGRSESFVGKMTLELRTGGRRELTIHSEESKVEGTYDTD